MSLKLDTSQPLKAQWAYHHAIKGTLKEYNRHRDEMGDNLGSVPLPKDELPPPPVLVKNPPKKSEWGSMKPQTVKMGVVGAGAAGLFTAQVLEHLNARLGEKGVPLSFEYDILEAAGPDRVGGRLFTYDFGGPREAHDYYDVGAMRFPDNPVMQRTFDLFAKLKMEKVDFKTNPNAPDGSLIPYYMNNGGVKKGKEPWCYNDINIWATEYANAQSQGQDDDPFLINAKKTIPEDVFAAGPANVMKDNIENVRKALKQPGNAGWDLLMTYDKYSTRQFLGTAPNPQTEAGDAGKIQPPPYNYDTIEWMETFNGGTDWYDQAHSETVLENLDFDYDATTKWFCILGGAQQLAKKMEGAIAKKPTYNTRVTAIRANGEMSVDVDYKTSSGETGTKKSYDAVITTTTLGCMRQMDLRKAGLSYPVKQAIRSLGYGGSSKCAIKFTRAWWIHDLKSNNVKTGGLGHSDLSLRTCVYPSYNIYDKEGTSAVLLCSYTWQQDAERIGSLISNNPDRVQKLHEEERLKNLLLRDLAQLHASDEMPYDEVLKLITPLYDTHHAWDWSEDPNAAGAFAFFRPQQFSAMWPQLIQPSGDVVIVGEAASPHHAWVVGALESVVHGLHAWLGMNVHNNKIFIEAMKILASTDEKDKHNPYVGLPPYMGHDITAWQSFFGIVHREEHLSEIGAKSQEAPELYKMLDFTPLTLAN